MRLRRTYRLGANIVQVYNGKHWVDLSIVLACLPTGLVGTKADSWSTCLIEFLAAPSEVHAEVRTISARLPDTMSDAETVLLPFQPRSFRDFMLFERHAINAARGFVREFMPKRHALVSGYERLTGRDFPYLRPTSLWYRQPIYYMGNALNIVSHEAEIKCPSFSCALDYELELGFVLKGELCNPTPKEAEKAIGGFVVLNDFSARDIQAAEMASGFGPQKSKHFITSISQTLVTADELIDCWPQLRGQVSINGKRAANPVCEHAQWSLGEVIAHAGRDERLHRGELFATGTLPGGSGIENGRLLQRGDVIEVGFDRIDTLKNSIV